MTNKNKTFTEIKKLTKQVDNFTKEIHKLNKERELFNDDLSENKKNLKKELYLLISQLDKKSCSGISDIIYVQDELVIDFHEKRARRDEVITVKEENTVKFVADYLGLSEDDYEVCVGTVSTSKLRCFVYMDIPLK